MNRKNLLEKNNEIKISEIYHVINGSARDYLPLIENESPKPIRDTIMMIQVS